MNLAQEVERPRAAKFCLFPLGHKRDAIGAAIRDGAAIAGRASPLGPFGLKPSPAQNKALFLSS